MSKLHYYSRGQNKVKLHWSKNRVNANIPQLKKEYQNKLKKEMNEGNQTGKFVYVGL